MVTTTRRPKRRKGRPPPEAVQVDVPVPSFFRLFALPFDPMSDEFAGEAAGYGAAEEAAGIAHPATLQEAVLPMVRETLIPHATAYYLKAVTGMDGIDDDDVDDGGDLEMLRHTYGKGIEAAFPGAPDPEEPQQERRRPKKRLLTKRQ